MTRSIPLTRGKVALVSDADYEFLSKFKWTYGGAYAVRMPSRKLGKRKFITMHREILHAPDGVQVDHINLNKLDNRRENLRLCTDLENARNLPVRTSSKSGYKGVSWSSDHKKWHVRIMRKHVGYFSDIEDAARAYDEAARKYFGEFARLNFEKP